MFPEEMRAFHAVVQTGSIRKASDRLDLAPSSVSRKVALLEHHIGAKLLERTAAGVTVTHAGGLVAEFVRAVLVDYDSLRTDLGEERGGVRALLRLAVVEGVLSAGPLAVVARFRQRFDRVTFTVQMLPAPQVVEVVLQGHVDIGITFSPQADPDLDTVARLNEPIVLVTLGASKEDRNGTVTLADICGIPLAVPAPEFGISRLLDGACRAGGISLTKVLSSNSFDALRRFVLAGGGGAILPQRAMRGFEHEPLIHAAVIDDERLKNTTLDIIMLKKRRTSRVLKLFRDSLVDSLA